MTWLTPEVLFVGSALLFAVSVAVLCWAVSR
jgi:hypothetical protein